MLKAILPDEEEFVNGDTDLGRIRMQLKAIESVLIELAGYLPTLAQNGDFESDMQRRAIERVFILAIDGITDCNALLLKQVHVGTKGKSSFWLHRAVSNRLKAISWPTAVAFVGDGQDWATEALIEQRNVLVHRGGYLTAAAILSAARGVLAAGKRYVLSITAYLRGMRYERDGIEVVWFTSQGKSYHRSTCKQLKAGVGVPIVWARQRLSPCGRCKPEETGND